MKNLFWYRSKRLKGRNREVKEDKKMKALFLLKQAWIQLVVKLLGHEAKMVKEKDGDKESWKID